MPRPHVSIRFRAIFPGMVDAHIYRQRIRKHLEDMGAIHFVEWEADPLRCFSCNQAESEDNPLRKAEIGFLCDGCRLEEESA